MKFAGIKLNFIESRVFIMLKSRTTKVVLYEKRG